MTGLKLFQRKPGYANHALNVAFAFGAAVLIWGGIGARLVESRTLPVRLEILTADGVDARLLDGDTTVRVTFEGPKATVDSLSQNAAVERIFLRAKVKVTTEALAGEIRREVILDLDPTRDVEIPRRLTARLRAVSCEPPYVRLELAPTVEREYPTSPVPVGQVRRREVALDRLEPAIDRARVRGSLFEIERYERDPANRSSDNLVVIKTRGIDVSNAVETFTTFVPFDLPETLRALPNGTEVTVVFKREDYDSEYVTKAFELRLHYLLPASIEKAYIYELRPPRETLRITLEGRKSEIQEFERALNAADPERHPYAILRVSPQVSPGPASGEVELGNYPSDRVTIKGDNAILYNVREPGGR